MTCATRPLQDKTRLRTHHICQTACQRRLRRPGSPQRRLSWQTVPSMHCRRSAPTQTQWSKTCKRWMAAKLSCTVPDQELQDTFADHFLHEIARQRRGQTTALATPHPGFRPPATCLCQPDLGQPDGLEAAGRCTCAAGHLAVHLQLVRDSKHTSGRGLLSCRAQAASAGSRQLNRRCRTGSMPTNTMMKVCEERFNRQKLSGILPDGHIHCMCRGLQLHTTTEARCSAQACRCFCASGSPALRWSPKECWPAAASNMAEGGFLWTGLLDPEAQQGSAPGRNSSAGPSQTRQQYAEAPHPQTPHPCWEGGHHHSP